jgi:hypothetical protein
MQGRGFTPTVVENAIQTGDVFPAKFGRVAFYDAVNNITVITESNGTVVTVRYGPVK